MLVFQPLVLMIISYNISQFRTSPLPCMLSFLTPKHFLPNLFAVDLIWILGVDVYFSISTLRVMDDVILPLSASKIWPSSSKTASVLYFPAELHEKCLRETWNLCKGTHLSFTHVIHCGPWKPLYIINHVLVKFFIFIYFTLCV